MLARKHLPGATHSTLDFINHEQNTVLVTNAPQSIQKTFRRGHVTTFTLHGLDDDRRYFLRRRRRLEQTLSDPVERALSGSTIAAVSRAERIIKLVRIRHVHDVERLALETLALRCLRRRQRKRAECAPVKTVEERDELLATSRVHREFQRSFNCFSAAVGEMRSRRRLHGN